MGTFNWFNINFYSHCINEKNTSSFGKAEEMINSFTRGYHFKRSTSDNYLDLLLYLHLDKNNFEWTGVVGKFGLQLVMHIKCIKYMNQIKNFCLLLPNLS